MSEGVVRATVEEMIVSLRDLDDVGSRRESDGTLRIRKGSPRRDGLFTDAYLHTIYAGLRPAGITQIEEMIGKPLPRELAAFYLQANGLSIFSGSMSIGGLRTNYSRDPSILLPVSVEYGNTLDVPLRVDGGYDGLDQCVRFGFYADEEGYELMMRNDGDPYVYLLPRFRTGPVLHTWGSFSNFLRSETERFVREYVKIDGKIDALNVLPPPHLASGA